MNARKEMPVGAFGSSKIPPEGFIPPTLSLRARNRDYMRTKCVAVVGTEEEMRVGPIRAPREERGEREERRDRE